MHAAGRRLCRDLANGERVAVKLFQRPLSPSAVEQVVQGIAIQAELGEGCINIVTLHKVSQRCRLDYLLCLALQAGTAREGRPSMAPFCRNIGRERRAADVLLCSEHCAMLMLLIGGAAGLPDARLPRR